MSVAIQTVTGPITPEKLGRTLMHEHVLVGYAGWEADWIRPGPSRQEMLARAADKLEEMKAEGITSMIDPCPSIATSAPITSRTDRGTMGPDQQKFLTDLGVPAHCIIISHCCGTSDHEYHLKIARGGSYLGFDRFGLDIVHPDDERVASLLVDNPRRFFAGDALPAISA